ncbi:MAG TPA: peptidase M48 [Bacteroidales bacterium]|nr:peptidase M48 [Bacteroidales bacterium]
MDQPLLYVLVGIVVLSFLFDLLLDYLNSTLWTNSLPEEVKEVYDQDSYKRSQDYEKENFGLSRKKEILTFLLTMAFLIMGGFGWLDEWARGVSENPIVIALVFFAGVGIIFGVVSFPFGVYHTFVVEQKYGFNTITIKTFVLDTLKGILLTSLIGGGLLALFIWFYEVAGQWFWIYAWIVFTAFSVLMMMFYSTLIVPIFNKQTPLGEGEVRNAIEAFAKKAGFSISNIFVIDGSKRSTKANAYFAGLGKQKRIVLYDTLIKDYTTEELVAILAHEIGHYKKKHVRKGLLMSVANTGFTLAILALVIDNPALSQALGSSVPSAHLGLLAFGILFAPLSMATGIMANYLSRKHEYEADAFAATQYDSDAAQSALKKLYKTHLANLRPHPWYEFVHFSHPGLLKRLKHLKKFSTHDTRNYSTG